MAVGLIVPAALGGGDFGTGLLPWSLLPVAGLIVGIAALRAGARNVGQWALLAMFPVALGFAVVALDRSRAITMSPLTALLASVSLGAYLAGTIATLSDQQTRRAATHKPLDPLRALPKDARRATFRWIIMGSCAVATSMMTTVVPAALSTEDLRPSWGGSSAQAAVLTAVVGLAISIIAVAAIVGPAMRAEREQKGKPRNRRTRVIAFICAAAISFTTYLIIDL